MTNSPHISLNTFKEISMSEKARVIQMSGTLLIATSAFGVDFFLYSINDYFVEVTSLPKTGDVVYIRATNRPDICDMYLDAIELPMF
jgi:hypothetical protein